MSPHWPSEIELEWTLEVAMPHQDGRPRGGQHSALLAEIDAIYDLRRDSGGWLITGVRVRGIGSDHYTPLPRSGPWAILWAEAERAFRDHDLSRRADEQAQQLAMEAA